jgi:hypothetical protein
MMVKSPSPPETAAKYSGGLTLQISAQKISIEAVYFACLYIIKL